MQNKSLQEIDYSPLNAMNNVWSTAIKETFKVPVAVVVIAVIIVTVVAVYFLGGQGIFIAIIVYAFISGKVISQKSKIWKNFAAKNGWQIIAATGNDPRFIPPGIYGVGDSPKISDVIRATFENHVCDVFMYQYSTGAGKSRQTHYYTIARVTLARPFPHIILDSKNSWAIQNRGQATDDAKLEGDFNNSFSLYFDKNDQINALSVITPDVMSTLIASNTNQDIEIIDTNLFFMINLDKRTAAAMPAIFKSVDALADEIDHKAETIQYKPDMTTQERAMMLLTSQSFAGIGKITTAISWAFIFILGIPVIIMVLVGMLASLSI